MKETVTGLLKQMKSIKIPASKIEKDLKFSNGQLGQVAKGKSKLSEERLGQFTHYCWLKLTDGKATGSFNPETKETKVVPPKDTKKEIDRLVEEVEQKTKEPKPQARQPENKYLNERWKLKMGIK